VIPLSRTAAKQLHELTRYYADRDRDDAIENLIQSVERASERYQASRGLFYSAPRPYPSLVRPGWKWTKEGRYWIAFRQGKRGPVISAIFHEAADIPRRL
jgi:plasmid stabilization system protein ParE